jgi:FAD/FMN-containing dehydrogenase
LSGTALTRGDHGYDEARSAWNGEIDRYPAVIARCQSVADVAATIGFARQCGLEISVRGGFHNAAGTAICDDGVMIDLSSLRHVEVDPAIRRGVNCYEKSLFLDELSDEAIAVIIEQLARKTSLLSILELYRLGGAYSEVGEDETAFGSNRSSRFGVFMLGFTDDPESLAAARTWVGSCWEAMRPHATGAGGYLNAMMGDIEEDRVRAAYGPAKYERLARIKAEYDPDNVFHHNINIKPVLQPI